jgi:enamine deaminase RidA (YjgF/YER057c/UK114 family)
VATNKKAIEPSVIPPGSKAGQVPAAMAQGVKCGDTIFLAGVVAYDESGALVGEGDARAQADQCFRNIERLLKQADATLDDLVEVTCYLRDLQYLEGYLGARTAAFSQQHPPATTTIVAMLGRPELLVEVKAVAVIGAWQD